MLLMYNYVQNNDVLHVTYVQLCIQHTMLKSYFRSCFRVARRNWVQTNQSLIRYFVLKVITSWLLSWLSTENWQTKGWIMPSKLNYLVTWKKECWPLVSTVTCGIKDSRLTLFLHIESERNHR